MAKNKTPMADAPTETVGPTTPMADAPKKVKVKQFDFEDSDIVSVQAGNGHIYKMKGLQAKVLITKGAAELVK